MLRLVDLRDAQCVVVALLWMLLAGQNPALRADILTLKNGLQYEGSLGKISEIGEDPTNPSLSGGTKVTNIIFVDNGLSRTFVSSKDRRTFSTEPINMSKIRVDKRVASGNKRIGGVGPVIKVHPWDKFGNRVYSFSTPRGPLDVIQGITEITPLYTRIEGLAVRNPLIWDMRVATSSIPRQVLSDVLVNHIDKTNSNDRLQIVQLYVESNRFSDAELELAKIMEDFPGLKKNLEQQQTRLKQMAADQTIREIEYRRDAGQLNWTQYLLRNFQSDGVAGETLLKVKDIADEYDRQFKQGEQIIALLDGHIAELTDASTMAEVVPIRDEIKAELGFNTLRRMADYLRLASDDSMKVDQKLALAISGWLLGNGKATQNLAVATSLFQVRNLIHTYLRSESHQVRERADILAEMEQLEGGSPKYVASLIANMKPAAELPEPHADVVGMYDVTIPGIENHPEFSYLVQLPPEYDPYRRYPCVVSLTGSRSSAEDQVNWWAGAYNEDVKMRTGQATRHGYIVIAPRWLKQYQRKYEYSGREHAAVLFSLRDACRHFSIDTDRVFLSGHSIGGDAAWDIGLSHPDLFAGVIPISAKADKYVGHYAENGRGLPLYFVCGDMDANKITLNKNDWNRYLKRARYDCTVVLYRGRGHEHFHDEIQRIFAWMQVKQRNFLRDEFLCESMRPWDSFFFWAELEQLPERSMVAPVSWPKKGARAAEIEGQFVKSSNTVSLTSGAAKSTVWLTPDMVDFDERITVRIDRRRLRQEVTASTQVILEDVRTRGDRQHPFWAKVEN